MLTHLALLIDLKEEHLEKTHVPFLRKQLRTELEDLYQRFRAEYREHPIPTNLRAVLFR